MLRRLLQQVQHFSLSSTISIPRNSREMSKTSNIHLYTTATPNGLKITTALEELGLVSLHKLVSNTFDSSCSPTKSPRSTSPKTPRKRIGFARSTPMAASPPSQTPCPRLVNRSASSSPVACYSTSSSSTTQNTNSPSLAAPPKPMR